MKSADFRRRFSRLWRALTFFLNNHNSSSICLYFCTAYLPARNLVFSDVTSNSFKVGWSPAGSEVLSYLVKYKVAVGGEDFIISVPASSTSSVLTNLLPETTYAVSVISEYEDGDGPSLDGEETTLEGNFPIILSHKQVTRSNNCLLY